MENGILNNNEIIKIVLDASKEFIDEYPSSEKMELIIKEYNKNIEEFKKMVIGTMDTFKRAACLQRAIIISKPYEDEYLDSKLALDSSLLMCEKPYKYVGENYDKPKKLEEKQMLKLERSAKEVYNNALETIEYYYDKSDSDVPKPHTITLSIELLYQIAEKDYLQKLKNTLYKENNQIDNDAAVYRYICSSDKVILLDENDNVLGKVPVSKNIGDELAIRNTLIELNDAITDSEDIIIDYYKRHKNLLKNLARMSIPLAFIGIFHTTISKSYITTGIVTAASIAPSFVMMAMFGDRVITKKKCLENIVKKEKLMKYRDQLTQKLEEYEKEKTKLPIYFKDTTEYEVNNDKYMDYIDDIDTYATFYDSLKKGRFIPLYEDDKNRIMDIYKDDLASGTNYKSMLPKRKNS